MKLGLYKNCPVEIIRQGKKNTRIKQLGKERLVPSESVQLISQGTQSETHDHTASSYPAAACQSCGGWSKSGGMSHKADGAEGCNCSPCRDTPETPETPKTHTNGGFGGFDGYDLVLISCCGEKLEGEHRAEDLYQSQLFKASVAWAKANGKEWAILSAKYGLVWPDEVIESYDVVLSAPKSRSPHLKPIYYKNVIKKIRDYKNRVSCPKIAVLAGKHYLEPFQYEPNTSFPLAGKGIGQRLQFLKKAAVAVTACVGQLELF